VTRGKKGSAAGERRDGVDVVSGSEQGRTVHIFLLFGFSRICTDQVMEALPSEVMELSGRSSGQRSLACRSEPPLFVAGISLATHGLVKESEIEIRPVLEMDDFGKGFTPEVRAQEERLRAEMGRQQKS